MNFGKTLEKLREINNLYAKIYSDRDRSINKIQQDQEQNQKKVESQVKNLLEIYQDGQAKLYLEQIIQNIKKKQGFLAQDVPPIISYSKLDEKFEYSELYNHGYYQLFMPYCQLAYLGKENSFAEEQALELSMLFEPTEEPLTYLIKNMKQDTVVQDKYFFPANGDGQRPLHLAILKNDKAMIEQLIKHGADVNEENKEGFTPLSLAFRRSDRDIIKQLINNGADVNVEVEDGSTPLHEATKVSNQEMVELLIEKKARVNVQDKYGLTPLNFAIRVKNQDLFMLLINNGAKVNVDEGYPAPLHDAILTDSLDMAKELLKREADVSVKDNHGFTPLNSAAFRGNTEMVGLLIKKGVDVDGKNTEGFTSLHLAFKKQMYYPVEKQDTAMMDLLINHGADVNEKDGEGNTLLCIAVEKQNQKMVEWLLSHKADINAKGKKGYTPLRIAMERQDVAMIDLLLNKKANVNKKANEEDQDALLCTAVEKKNPVMITCLLSHGLDINAKGEKGYTPLRLAVERQDVEMADLLIKSGADVNDRDEEGNTLLCIAAEKQDQAMVECLLSHKAKIDAKGKNGLSPLGLAIQNLMELTTTLLNLITLNPASQEVEAIKKLGSYCQRSNEAVIQVLTDNGAIVTDKDQKNLQLAQQQFAKIYSVQVSEKNDYSNSGNKSSFFPVQSGSSKVQEDQPQCNFSKH